MITAQPQYINDLKYLMHICIIIGTFACAVSGAIRAIESKMGIIGALMIGFIVSVGGGTYRDIILGVHVFWVNDIFFLWFSILISFLTYIVILFNRKISNHKILDSLINITDTIGFSIFCLVGVQKAILSHCSYLVVIFMGVCSAVAGGITADVITNRSPTSLSSNEFYVLNALIGAITYVALDKFFVNALAGLFAFLIMIILRSLSLKYNWKLPSIQ